MTLIEVLPKIDNEIEIPVAAKKGEDVFSGTVSLEWLQANFTDFVDLTVPLSDTDFELLKSHISGNWSENWQHFRNQGLI